MQNKENAAVEEKSETLQESEVKKEVAEQEKTDKAQAEPKAEENEQSKSEENSPADQKISENEVAMLELEETLKSLKPEEVQRYQRELSAEMGENLFTGKIGELFKQYKPQYAERKEKVKNVASLFKSKEKPQQETSAKTDEQNIKSELLKTKVELELVKQGVPATFLEEATIVALSKIKDASELDKLQDVSSKFAALNTKPTVAEPIPAKTSVGIGDKKNDMTEGEKAIAFLKKLNPKGFK